MCTSGVLLTEHTSQLASEIDAGQWVEKEVDAIVEAEDGFGDVEGSTEVGWAAGAGTSRKHHHVDAFADSEAPSDEVREVEGDKTSRYHQQ